MKGPWPVVALACLLVGTGCMAKSELVLELDEAAYPISFSKSYLDRSGRRRTPGEDAIVGRFERSWRHSQMAWGTVQLSRPFDLETYLEQQIERHAGSAVVNLRVEARFGIGYWLTTLLMVFPESVGILLEGDIVGDEPSS